MTLMAAVTAAGIKHAHIVDDAFDKLPGAGLVAREINTFINAIDDEQFTTASKILGVADEEGAVSSALSRPEGAAALFREKDRFGKPAEDLFQDFTMATKPEKDRLEELIRFLTALGITCHTFGRGYDVEHEPEPQLLFVDLKLNEQQIVIAEPINVVMRLKQHYRQANPLVFLMSTQEQALKAQRAEFRDRCELFSSQFEDLPKRMIATTQALRRFVAHHVDAYPRVVQMRKHIEAWEKAMNDAQRSLLSTFRRLDLPDYFVLHNTAAADQGELGGYLVDLMLGYIGNEIERSQGVADFAATINKLDPENLKRSRFNIEPIVGDVFSANIVVSAERLKAERERGYSPSHGFLNLGDIFFHRDEIAAKSIQTAWVVLTPACDLARPEVIEKREASIFFCEGRVKKLTPTTDLIGKENLDQAILRHGDDGTQYAIDWRRKKVHTWNISDFKDLRAEPDRFLWVHSGRLRPLYALQLQRVVFGDLERVGTMRRPAPYVPHGIEVLIPHGDKWSMLPMNNDYAHNATAGAISDDKGMQKKTFVLLDVLLREAFESMTVWIERNGTEATIAIVKSLSDCDEALDRLMFHVASTKEKKPPPGEQVDYSVYPLEEAALPEALKPALAKSVVLASQNRPQDDGYGSGKVRPANSGAVLVFRFIKP